MFQTPEEGAQTHIHLAVSDDVKDISGQYFQNCRPHRPFIKKDLAAIREVWDQSIKLVKLSKDEIKV